MSRGRLRISAGALKGRVLQVPSSARPTEGRVREALFSIWADRIEGASLLDLFAGSGAIGLEAVSRGAERAVFVESDRRAARTLARNLEHLGLSRGAAELRVLPVPEAIATALEAGESFDLIFADPPYSWSLPPGFLADLGALLPPDGRIAFERAAGSPLPAEETGLVRLATRRYGGSVLLLYARG